MEEVRIEGWKGKSTREVIDIASSENYKVIEYRKDKSTGAVTEMVKVLPKKNVNVVRNIVEDNFGIAETCGYRYLVRALKKHYRLNVDTEAWNGGKNRAKYYFPYHYYPLKVLEAQGVVRYSGGKVTRLQ